ncbi:hypothetical protein EMPS_05383 [Entomortierella parvispora]|uniref:BTB domain-containing protein n=1 Tax=Entomortierella parvispora TaxID=205924 RepID=A0A9P3HAM1_9FUNG|nr:hypothetical protein EMPS_05383 [Entomortierella parvispora]
MPMPLLTTTALEPSTPAVSDQTDHDPTVFLPDIAADDRLPAPSDHDTPPAKYSYSLPVSALTSASSTPNRKRSPSVAHRRNQSHGHIIFPTFAPPAQQFPDQHPTSHISAPPSNASPFPSSMPMSLASGRPKTKATTAPIVERESYTLSDRTSTFVQTTGEIPPPLIGSSTTIHKGRMFVFGGKQQGGGPSNELYVLDLATLVWTRVLETTELSETTSQSSVSAAGCFHPLSPCSHQPMLTNTSTVRSIGPRNPSPRARYDHSAVLVVAPPLVHVDGSLRGWAGENEAHLVIHGGRTVDEGGAEISLSDTHILDMETLRWIPTSFARPAETMDGTQPLTTQGPLAVPEQQQQHQQQQQQGVSATITSTPVSVAEPSAVVTPFMTTTLEPKSTSGLRTLKSPLLHPSSDGHGLNIPSRDTSLDPTTPTSLPKNSELNANLRQPSPCPIPRFGHLASLSGDQMLVIGGQKPSGEYIQDIDILDLKRQVWISGGKTAGLYSRRLSTLAASEEKPMVRRRRRYLECLAADLAPSAMSTPTTPAAEPLSSQPTPTPTSALIDPLLNPRKNSWHRGEGHPFDIPNVPMDFRQRFKSESGVYSGLERNDNIWNQQNENTIGGKAHGLVGLGMDPEISKAMAQSAGLSLTVEEAMARARKSSTSLPKSPRASISGQSSSSEKSRTKSVSSSQKPNGRSFSSSPVTHAVPAKFFAKSAGGNVFDLDNLATTIAREQPKLSPGKGRGSAVKELSPISSRRSSGSSASSGPPRRGSESSTGPTKSPAPATKRNVSEGIPSIASVAQETVKPNPNTTRSLHLPTPVYPAQYVYANRDDNDVKTKREFIKVQARAGALEQSVYKIHLDVKSEWAALEEPASLLGSTQGLLPPKLESPVGHIIDHYFLLSGASILEKDSTNLSSEPALATPAVPAVTTRRRSFSVWMHHLQNHQWTQLELSKGLGSGDWNHAVIDPDGNYLYVLGQRKTRYPISHSTDEAELGPLDEVKPTMFTHLVKVDLEGFEISPDVDESSVGPLGVSLGLQMLRDGVAADVVLVSSADGGRVRVNSGIVGQRWGHFQALMEEHERNRTKTTQKEAGTTDLLLSPPLPPLSLTTKDYLSDTPVEVAVRETTPILVGFLQYLYTNELATAHQLKLKTLQGLLLIAHLYDLTRLRQLVRRELYRQLNANNAPAVCEVAVLTHEYGLQTRALRTLLQSARLAQLRRQGEAAEAKRRLDFAVSRLEEIEEDRKRKESMRQNSIQDLTRAAHSVVANVAMSSGHNHTAARSGSVVSSNSASGASTPGLGAIGRFFRGREESTDLSSSSSPLNPRSSALSGPGAMSAPIYTPEFDIDIGSTGAMHAPPVAVSPAVRMRTVSATSPGVTEEQVKRGHLRSRSFHQPMSQQHEFGVSGADPAHALTLDAHPPPAHPLSSPRLSAAGIQRRNTPPPHTAHLTLAQKIQKRLSIKHREPALDYFRPSHYHPPPDMHAVPAHQRSHPNLPSALSSPSFTGQSGARHLNSSTELEGAGEFSSGNLSNPTSNHRYSYSSVDSEGTSSSMYGAPSSAFTGSEEIGKVFYYSAASTVSSSSLPNSALTAYENTSSQSLDQMQGHSSSQAPGNRSASSLGHSSHGSLDQALSKKERKLAESQRKREESKRRREQKVADRAAATVQTPSLSAFAAYR